MKSFLFILALILVYSAQGQTVVKAKLGMSLNELAVIYPITLPDSGTFTGLWRRPERMEKIKGEWYYYFTRDTLRDFRFMSYPKALTKRRFNRYNRSADELIELLNLQFGEPLNIGGNTPDYKALHANIKAQRIKTAVWRIANTDIHMEYGSSDETEKPLYLIMTFHPVRR